MICPSNRKLVILIGNILVSQIMYADDLAVFFSKSSTVLWQILALRSVYDVEHKIKMPVTESSQFVEPNRMNV